MWTSKWTSIRGTILIPRTGEGAAKAIVSSTRRSESEASEQSISQGRRARESAGWVPGYQDQNNDNGKGKDMGITRYCVLSGQCTCTSHVERAQDNRDVDEVGKKDRET